MYPPAIFMLIVVAASLTYGLISGRMPAGRASPAIKTDDPSTYWMLAGLHVAMMVGFLIWGLLKR